MSKCWRRGGGGELLPTCICCGLIIMGLGPGDCRGEPGGPGGVGPLPGPDPDILLFWETHED